MALYTNIVLHMNVFLLLFYYYYFLFEKKFFVWKSHTQVHIEFFRWRRVNYYYNWFLSIVCPVSILYAMLFYTHTHNIKISISVYYYYFIGFSKGWSELNQVPNTTVLLLEIRHQFILFDAHGKRILLNYTNGRSGRVCWKWGEVCIGVLLYKVCKYVCVFIVWEDPIFHPFIFNGCIVWRHTRETR